MIKKLLLTALLAPGLAYGQVSAVLDPPVVPAGQNPTVPAPAVSAGFTTNVVKADFTTPGNYWSNTANYITNCGAAASVPNQPSTWHFDYTVQATQGTALPCDHTVITTDPVYGNQALEQIYTASDFNQNISSPNAASLFFPIHFTGGSNNTYWLSNQLYTKVVVRIDHNSVFHQPITGGSQEFGAYTWWSSTTVFGHSWLDEDYAEGAPFNTGSCGSSSYIGSLQEGTATDPIHFSSQVCFAGDITQYHTIETLVTSDESTDVTFCGWFDGHFIGCTNRPYPMTYDNGFAYSRRDRSVLSALSIVGGNPKQATNDLIAYIKSIEIWSCPNFATQTCAGSIVDHWPFP